MINRLEVISDVSVSVPGFKVRVFAGCAPGRAFHLINLSRRGGCVFLVLEGGESNGESICGVGWWGASSWKLSG